MTNQLQSETLQFNLYKMYKMTTKTRSGIMTRKTRSKIGGEFSAYFAPNYHLCQNYTESGSFLTVRKDGSNPRIQGMVGGTR